MKKFLDILKAFGSFVDAVVPVGIGSRTKFAVFACPVLGIVGQVAPALGIPGADAFLPLIPAAQKALCAAAPAFAFAGLVRESK